MKKNTLYMTTGEFAKLCRTTKHTLFHYCDIGLFSPAYTDENGYRYYHALQYDSFLTITQLRTIGMPLAEIKDYMAERSPQRMVELYAQQEQAIRQQIARLTDIKERISSQKRSIMEVLTCSEEFFLDDQPARPLLCSATITQADDYAMTAAIGNLIHFADGRTASNALGMLCDLHEAACSNAYPFRFYLYGLPSCKDSCKLAGTYLTTYHRGDYETLPRSYQNLIAYADVHHLKLDQWVYAETIIGDWAVHQPQDYIIKISAKIADPSLSFCAKQE